LYHTELERLFSLVPNGGIGPVVASAQHTRRNRYVARARRRDRKSVGPAHRSGSSVCALGEADLLRDRHERSQQ
jgi:hypothetical protein